MTSFNLKYLSKFTTEYKISKIVNLALDDIIFLFNSGFTFDYDNDMTFHTNVNICGVDCDICIICYNNSVNLTVFDSNKTSMKDFRCEKKDIRRIIFEFEMWYNIKMNHDKKMTFKEYTKSVN